MTLPHSPLAPRGGRVALVLAGLIVAACTAQAQPGAEAAHDIRIAAEPIPLDPKDARAGRIGNFAYAGGLRLTSPDTSLFGGLSDLKIGRGGELVAETDEGNLLRARIVLDAQGRLVGLDRASLGPLTGLRGAPLQGKAEADAEGVAVWPNGDLMVSFERDHRIWLYPRGGGDPAGLPKPAVSMPDNEGMEALALAPSQGSDAYWVGIEGGAIWLCRLKAACTEWSGFIKPSLLFRLTAVAETPQGDLVILHHSWNPLTGSRVRLSIVTIPRPGKPSRVRDTLELGPNLNIDNFEGVAAVPAPGGGLRLYLISDDNFSPRQRTLLEAFDWTLQGGRGR